MSEKDTKIEINEIKKTITPGDRQKAVLITFLLGKETYAADIYKLREVINYPEITPIPRAIEYISGVINLRGEIIPIIDLRGKTNMMPKPRDENTRIIICLDTNSIGLIVDRIIGVVKIPKSQIKNPKPATNLETSNLEGITYINDRIISILNLDKVLTIPLEDKTKNEHTLIERGREHYLAYMNKSTQTF